FFFFFSSRRRHTRFSRDWSSDVCSSDLTGLPATITVEEDSNEDLFDISTVSIGDIDAGSGNLSLILVANGGVFDVAAGTGMTIRSEERRVGKECRCRWWPEEDRERGEGR